MRLAPPTLANLIYLPISTTGTVKRKPRKKANSSFFAKVHTMQCKLTPTFEFQGEKIIYNTNHFLLMKYLVLHSWSIVKIKKCKKDFLDELLISKESDFNSLRSFMINVVILLIRNIHHLKTNNFFKVCIEQKSSVCKIWGRCYGADAP